LGGSEEWHIGGGLGSDSVCIHDMYVRIYNHRIPRRLGKAVAFFRRVALCSDLSGLGPGAAGAAAFVSFTWNPREDISNPEKQTVEDEFKRLKDRRCLHKPGEGGNSGVEASGWARGTPHAGEAHTRARRAATARSAPRRATHRRRAADRPAGPPLWAAPAPGPGVGTEERRPVGPRR